LRDDTWRKERTSSKLTLWEICGEVLWKALKPRDAEKILVVDQEKIQWQQILQSRDLALWKD
jgi:hypothetical protein